METSVASFATDWMGEIMKRNGLKMNISAWGPGNEWEEPLLHRAPEKPREPAQAP